MIDDLLERLLIRCKNGSTYIDHEQVPYVLRDLLYYLRHKMPIQHVVTSENCEEKIQKYFDEKFDDNAKKND